MQSTEVSAERSAAEITSLLVQAGAHEISTQYNNGKVSGLRFRLMVASHVCTFELPARTEPVFQLLKRAKPWSRSYSRLDHKDYEKKLRGDAERIG